MEEAFKNFLIDEEKIIRHDALATMVFLRTLQSLAGITSLVSVTYGQIVANLSPFY